VSPFPFSVAYSASHFHYTLTFSKSVSQKHSVGCLPELLTDFNCPALDFSVCCVYMCTLCLAHAPLC
jgi:hypothetical protein